ALLASRDALRFARSCVALLLEFTLTLAIGALRSGERLALVAVVVVIVGPAVVDEVLQIEVVELLEASLQHAIVNDLRHRLQLELTARERAERIALFLLHAVLLIPTIKALPLAAPFGVRTMAAHVRLVQQREHLVLLVLVLR